MRGKLEPCEACHLPYYHQLITHCPRCGHVPGAPLPAVPAVRKAGWGGKRKHAGAPPGNLNRLLHGRQSKLLRQAIEKMAADPELRVFFYLVARAVTGEGAEGLPETTKRLIIRLMEPAETKARRAGRRVFNAKTLGN
jgi:hypothetical protein